MTRYVLPPSLVMLMLITCPLLAADTPSDGKAVQPVKPDIAALDLENVVITYDESSQFRVDNPRIAITGRKVTYTTREPKRGKEFPRVAPNGPIDRDALSVEVTRAARVEPSELRALLKQLSEEADVFNLRLIIKDAIDKDVQYLPHVRTELHIVLPKDKKSVANHLTWDQTRGYDQVSLKRFLLATDALIRFATDATRTEQPRR